MIFNHHIIISNQKKKLYWNSGGLSLPLVTDILDFNSVDNLAKNLTWNFHLPCQLKLLD